MGYLSYIVNGRTEVKLVENKLYANSLQRFLSFVIDILIFKVIQFASNSAVMFLIYLIRLNLPNFIYDIFNFILLWIYFAYMESSKSQATYGKAYFGLIVTDLEGKRISFGKASIRFFSKILSFLLLLLGFIMIGFTKNKQGLHDIISGCLVLRREKGNL